MKFMSWSWGDLCEAPTTILAEIIDIMEEQARARDLQETMNG